MPKTLTRVLILAAAFTAAMVAGGNGVQSGGCGCK